MTLQSVVTELDPQTKVRAYDDGSLAITRSGDNIFIKPQAVDRLLSTLLAQKAQQESAVESVEEPAWQFNRSAHGSLYDRGSADSYYRRSPGPHYGGVGGHSGDRVEVTDAASVAEYTAGFDDNEANGDFKDWG